MYLIASEYNVCIICNIIHIHTLTHTHRHTHTHTHTHTRRSLSDFHWARAASQLYNECCRGGAHGAARDGTRTHSEKVVCSALVS